MKFPTLVLAAAVCLGPWLPGSFAQGPGLAPPPPEGPGLGAPPAFANDPAFPDTRVLVRKEPPKAQWQVRVSVQMVALPRAVALDLLPQFQSNNLAKVETACETIQAMIRKKEAVLLAWPTVIGLAGERQTVETTAERSFPSNFIPPQEPQTLGAGPSSIAQQVPLVPNSVETRVLGIYVSVEADVSKNGKWIDLILDPQRSFVLGFHSVHTGTTRDGTTSKLEVPDFATEKTTTTLTFGNGQCQLIAVHSLAKPEGYLEFVLVRATATKIE